MYSLTSKKSATILDGEGVRLVGGGGEALLTTLEMISSV